MLVIGSIEFNILNCITSVIKSGPNLSKIFNIILRGFKDKSKTNTLLFGSDDLKALSQSLDYGELSNLSKRQKEKIKEQILLARAGILNPTEFEKEVGLNLNKSQKDFLKTILPDETMEKIFMDDEGDFRKGFQKSF